MNRFQFTKMLTFIAAIFVALFLWTIEYVMIVLVTWKTEPTDWHLFWQTTYVVIAIAILVLVTDAYQEMQKHILK